SSVSVGIAPTYGARYLPRMPQQNKSLRKELLEARERILRQIDLCTHDPNFNAGNADAEPPAGAVPELMSELKQIEHTLGIIGQVGIIGQDEAVSRREKKRRFPMKKKDTIRRYVSYAAIAVVALIGIRWGFKGAFETIGILPQEELAEHWIFYLVALGGAI